MADEENEELENTEDAVEGEGTEDEGGDSKKKMIIIVAGVIVLLLAVGAGLFFTGVIGGSDPAVAEEGHEADDGHGDKADDHGKKTKDDDHGEKADGHGGESSQGDGHGAFLAIPTMNITLNADNGTPRYLRLTVQLELEDATDGPAIEAVMPRVVDKFQTYLRELRVKDLRGSGGIYRLQMELLWRVNQAASPVRVKDVLFQEILIQ